MEELAATIEYFLANPSEGAEAGRLTLEQLKKVIQSAGRAAGLTVQMEYPAQVTMFDQYLRGFLDCVWKRPDDGAVIVAWEIDGIDVGREHVFGHEVPPPWRRNAVGIIRKLSKIEAPTKVHALYSFRRCALQPDNSRLVQRWHNEQVQVPRQRVLVHTDKQLLTGSLMRVVTQAGAI
jgi:hypothetical protein